MSKNTNVNSQGMFKLPGEISIKVGRCPSSLPPLVLPSEVSPVQSLLLAKGTHPDLGDISNNLPPLEGEGFSSMNWPGNDPRDTVGMQHIDPSVVGKDSLFTKQINKKLSEETGVKSEIVEMNSRNLLVEGDKRHEVKCSSSSSNVQPQADSRPLQTSTTSQTSGNDKSPSAENGGKKANSSLNWFASIATQSDVLDPTSLPNCGSGGDPSSSMDVDVISRSKGTSSSSTPQDSANPVPSSLISKDVGDETNKTMIESSDGSLLYSKHDVLLNRGNAANRHEGNIFYRSLITESKSKYDNGFRKTKTSLTWWIISQVRGRGGRFLQKDKSGEKWVEANETVIRRKVAQAYRDTRRRMLVQNIP